MAPTTRRQQKRHNAVMQHAGLQSLKRPSRTATVPTTRHQRKRKAPLQELKEAPHSKRINHDNCTDGHCVAFQDQTGATFSKGDQLQEHRTLELRAASTELPPLRSSDAAPAPTSGLTSLPRELRDEIYKYVLHSSEKRAVTLQNRNFITKSGLVGVNSQIKDEFLDAVLFHAPVIHTTVRNHNFAHIVTFLNRLSDAQIRKFAAAATPNSDPDAKTRSRKIIITLTYTHTKTSTRPQLNRWLDRFDDPKRRGSEVRFEYRLDRESWRNGGYKQRVTERASKGPRSREEARKMLEVTRSVSSGYWW